MSTPYPQLAVVTRQQVAIKVQRRVSLQCRYGREVCSCDGMIVDIVQVILNKTVISLHGFYTLRLWPLYGQHRRRVGDWRYYCGNDNQLALPGEVTLGPPGRPRWQTVESVAIWRLTLGGKQINNQSSDFNSFNSMCSFSPFNRAELADRATQTTSDGGENKKRNTTDSI